LFLEQNDSMMGAEQGRGGQAIRTPTDYDYIDRFVRIHI
jgi:hypothetical protein